jgi:hypothetical protein
MRSVCRRKGCAPSFRRTRSCRAKRIRARRFHCNFRSPYTFAIWRSRFLPQWHTSQRSAPPPCTGSAFAFDVCAHSPFPQALATSRPRFLPQQRTSQRSTPASPLKALTRSLIRESAKPRILPSRRASQRTPSARVPAIHLSPQSKPPNPIRSTSRLVPLRAVPRGTKRVQFRAPSSVHRASAPPPQINIRYSFEAKLRDGGEASGRNTVAHTVRGGAAETRFANGRMRWRRFSRDIKCKETRPECATDIECR